MIETQNWLDEMAKKRKHLYAKYGKPLEKDHKGDFVAISFDGQTMVGKDLDGLTLDAYDTYGSGRFVVAKIGYDAQGNGPVSAASSQRRRSKRQDSSAHS